jgi:putative endopeptidase
MSRPSSFVLALALAACSADLPPPPPPQAAPPAPAAPVTPAAPAAPGHSIDLAAMDRSVRPGQDFFLHANGAWLAKAEIPADRSSTGNWLRVEEEIDRRTRALLDEAAAGKAPGLRKLGDFYTAYLDEAGIEARGAKPIAAALAKIEKLADARALAAMLGAELRADVDIMNNTDLHTDRVLGLWVEQDLNDPSRAAPYLVQGGLGMPDRSYYLDASPAMAAHREAYQRHLTRMLELAGFKDAAARARRVYDLEKRLAEAHVSRADSEDVTKGNNPWSRKDFDTRAPGMRWDAFFAAAGLDKQASFIVWHPSAVTGLAALVKSEPLRAWKDHHAARAVEHAAPYLSRAFAAEHFAFYGTELRGVPVAPPRWRQAVDETNAGLGEAVGKAYVERYFPPASKQAVEKMVADIVAAFARRIDALPWMSPATKARAKEKLGTLRVGIGYPDAWHDDSGLVVSRDDALGNVERVQLFVYRREIEKLGRPVDHGEWAMLPHEVNAVNLPIRNALNFPAGILMPPFFDPQATAAANYASIGAVIGHEISHSFDDQGAKFDAHGRYTTWWTPEDFAHFEASGAALAAQYSAYRPFPDVAVDGKQTLSENIADLAGLAAAHEAWRRSLGGAPAPEQDGLTGEQQFFLAFAQSWQEKEREPRLRQRLAADGHAPPHYRVLTVRNLDAWYAAFDVKPEDALYLDPAKRITVW